MTLLARERTIESPDGAERELVVACPQRRDPVPLRECATCELCGGLELAGTVGVRCTVASEDAVNGAPPAHAPITRIMTAPVTAVEADATLENTQWLLCDRRIGAVPVLDANRRPIGMLAQLDLLRDRDEPAISARPRGPALDEATTERAISGLRVLDVMTPVVHAAFERTSIAAVAALMAKDRVHHVIVIKEDGTLSGIVSTLDITAWVAARERFTPRSG